MIEKQMCEYAMLLWQEIIGKLLKIKIDENNLVIILSCKRNIKLKLPLSSIKYVSVDTTSKNSNEISILKTNDEYVMKLNKNIFSIIINEFTRAEHHRDDYGGRSKVS